MEEDAFSLMEPTRLSASRIYQLFGRTSNCCLNSISDSTARLTQRHSNHRHSGPT